MSRKRRVLLATGLIPMLLAALLGVLTWRQWRQARLDHTLVVAVNDNRRADIPRLLQQGANPMAQDAPAPTFTQMLRTLLFHSTSRPPANPVIVESALNQHWDVVDMLLGAGADVNARNDRKQSLLHFAALSIDRKFYLATSQDPHKNEAIEMGMPRLHLLLARHPNVNVQDWIGDTPLHYAASFQNGSFVQALLDAGAGVDIPNKGGETPLAFAAHGLHYDTAKVLLAHGADINHKDRRGSSILNYAIHYNGPQMIAFLKRNGAKEP